MSEAPPPAEDPGRAPGARGPGPGGVPPLPGWMSQLRWVAVAMILALAVLMVVLSARTSTAPTTTALTYSQFLSDVAGHKITTVDLASGGTATGTLKGGNQYTTVIPAQAGSALLSDLQSHGVAIQATAPSSGSGWASLLGWLVLLVPLGVLFWWSSRSLRRAGGTMGGLGTVGKARAQVIDAERPATKFADVAGYEGGQVRDSRSGRPAPQSGPLPPGRSGGSQGHPDGGTARDGQDPPGPGGGRRGGGSLPVGGGFELRGDVRGSGGFTGAGPLAEARKRAPAIIFVDEIDAIGGHRSVSGAGISNDEREQTLNQLLSELDGFDPAAGIVVLAATNRPEILDPALLRPGRFDRQVVIPLPTQTERLAILKVHCLDKRLAPDLDLDVVARATPGFSGADLANLANEAAINSVRGGRQLVSPDDFSTARDRILIGRRDGSNVLLADEKHAVAVHEAGHALVAALSEHAGLHRRGQRPHPGHRAGPAHGQGVRPL